MRRGRLTNEERGYLSIIRLNKIIDKKEIRKKWKFKNLEIEFHWRSKKNLWGRFGGGWNWCLGFELGSTTLILNLLIFSLSFRLKKENLK